MFPRRYFAGRYFPPRYWPQSGGDAPPVDNTARGYRTYSLVARDKSSHRIVASRGS